MKWVHASRLVLLCLVLLVGSTSCGKQTEPNPPEPLSTAEVAAKVNPSVVQIVTADGTGSGIILDADGHVLTNNHVIEKATSANVVLSDSRTLSARIVNRDWSIDLAVLKVAASDLQPATLGSSSEVQLGEDVVVLGYPLDLGSSVTVTKGIVSAFREPYVQTDAPVNPGNSGGPLVNMWGEVIGLVTAKPQTQGQEPTEGIGFAIAVDQMKDRLTDLLSPQEPSSLAAYGTVTDAQGSQWCLSTVDAFDNIHHLWGERTSNIRDYSLPVKLMYSVRSKDGSWATPETIAEWVCIQQGYDPYVVPKGMVIDSEGTVHVVWNQSVCGGNGEDFFYACKPLGQAWSTPILVWQGGIFSLVSLALDSADTLHLVGADSSCGTSETLKGIYYSDKPEQGIWSQPGLIEGTEQNEAASRGQPTLSCDIQGNLLLTYTLNSHTYAVRKPIGAPWAVPSLIPDAEQVGLPQVVVDGSGSVFLAFYTQSGRIGYSSLLPDQSLSAIEYLSEADHRSANIRLGRDACGTIYAVWERTPNPEDTDGESLILRWKTPGNPWSPEQLVYNAAVGHIGNYSFSVDSTGTGRFLISEYQIPSDPHQSYVYREFYLTLPLGRVCN